jgi:hypothetical protein
MTYFTEYPKITINNPLTDDSINVIDLFRRIKFEDNISQNTYKKYYVKDNERPEQIAFNFYGDTKYYWIILLLNNFSGNDWIMSNFEIDKMIYELPNADQIKYYETIELKNTDGIVVVPSGLIVKENFKIKIDETIYQNQTAIIPITYAEDIIRKNEKKRIIILLEPYLVSKLDDDFKNLIKYQTNKLTNIGTKFEES